MPSYFGTNVVPYRTEALPEVRLSDPNICDLLEQTVARNIGGLVVREASLMAWSEVMHRTSLSFAADSKRISFDGNREIGWHVDNTLRQNGDYEQVNSHFTRCGGVRAALIPLTANVEVGEKDLSPNLMLPEYTEQIERGLVDPDLGEPVCYTADIKANDILVFLDARNWHKFTSYPGADRKSVAWLMWAQLPMADSDSEVASLY